MTRARNGFHERVTKSRSPQIRGEDGEIPDSGRFVAKPYSPDMLVEEIRQATSET